MNAPFISDEQILSQAINDDSFFGLWLERLLAGLPGVLEAVLIWLQDNQLSPVAQWPQGQGVSPALAQLCEQSLSMQMLVQRADRGGALLALPLLQDGRVVALVALRFNGPQQPAHALAWLRWGLGWLLAQRGGDDSQQGAALQERLLLALDLIMLAQAQRRFNPAAQAVVTEAARRLGCDRVAVGLRHGHSIALDALSHSAEVSRKQALVHALEAAMNEAADQGEALSLGLDEPPSGHIVRAQAQLAHEFGNPVVLSIPVVGEDEQYGVWVFEWRAQPLADQLLLARSLSPILGHALLEKRQQDRPWRQRIKDLYTQQSRRLFGPAYPGRKLVAVTLTLFLLFCLFAFAQYRVAAPAVLEGGVRRVLVAPYDSFVGAAHARAGQTVKAGQLLASLDDKDLQLEVSRWGSQQQQYSQQASDAESQHNLAQIQISLAQQRQAEAQRALSENMLERSQVRAPFAGVIVAGDLSQALGAAIKKGQTLFEIAPLDSYRVVLNVDEADIAELVPGQSCQLMLTALPGQSLPCKVSLVTAVAEAKEGSNYFRVEATLATTDPRLRPGMEGIAKVNIDSRRLVWIWTHSLTDWLRLQAFHWLGW